MTSLRSHNKPVGKVRGTCSQSLSGLPEGSCQVKSVSQPSTNFLSGLKYPDCPLSGFPLRRSSYSAWYEDRASVSIMMERQSLLPGKQIKPNLTPQARGKLSKMYPGGRQNIIHPQHTQASFTLGPCLDKTIIAQKYVKNS